MNSFVFENYRFDGKRHELFRDDELVPLEPQICQVLYILLLNAGEIVARDTLLKEVWQGKSVSPSVIDNRIRAARRAIRDDGRSQRLIKTFMNEGYKFIGDVTMLAEDRLDQNDEPKTSEPSESRAKPRLPLKRSLIGAGILAAASLVFVVVLPNGFRTGSDAPDQVAAQPTQRILDEVRSSSTVAVLPFTTNSQDLRTVVENLHFAQSLIDTLSTIPDLKVVSSLSSFRFKDTSASPGEITDALGAGYLISGNVVAEADQLRVTIRMTEARTNLVKWTHTVRLPNNPSQFEEPRSKSVRTASLSLLNALGITSNLPSEGLISPDAHEEFEQATALLRSREGDQVIEAIAILEGVVAQEPNFVPAYTGMVFAHHLAAEYAGFTTVRAALAIDNYVEKAKSISSESPDVLVALGIQARYHDKLTLELQYYDRALAIDPNNQRAILLRAESLRRMGNVVAAEEAFEKALTFDPLSPVLLSRVARSKFENRSLREAFVHARENLRWNGQNVEALTDLAVFSKETGEYAQAYLLLSDALSIAPGNSEAQFQMLLLLHSIGQIERFEEFVTSPSYLVLGHTFAGDEAKAKASLSQDPLAQFAGYSAYIFGESTPLYEYLNVTGLFSELKLPDTQISTTFLFDAIFLADVNLKNADPEAETILVNVREYFRDRPLSSLELEEEYRALAGLHALEGDDQALLATIRAGIDEGFMFIGALERAPVFEAARTNAEFLSLIDQMYEQSSENWAAITAQADKLQSDDTVLD
ncbi:winged helix-turn-helix domain-containing protein [uncultured Tateyamaria sp.]|uniref:winged helix-turn-helix domain-containing protein n=1 Tax=uncultured Tateyamaria sp. TaxID=455651 RepID=UPI002608C608|nr:winged helix-turn-helix domain-containing protein [uncultured Tateyamaria sp.]